MAMEQVNTSKRSRSSFLHLLNLHMCKTIGISFNLERLRYTMRNKHMTEVKKKQIIEQVIESMIADSENSQLHTYQDIAIKAIEEILDRNDLNSSTTKPAINASYRKSIKQQIFHFDQNIEEVKEESHVSHFSSKDKQAPAINLEPPEPAIAEKDDDSPQYCQFERINISNEVLK